MFSLVYLFNIYLTLSTLASNIKSVFGIIVQGTIILGHYTQYRKRKYFYNERKVCTGDMGHIKHNKPYLLLTESHSTISVKQSR